MDLDEESFLNYSSVEIMEMMLQVTHGGTIIENAVESGPYDLLVQTASDNPLIEVTATIGYEDPEDTISSNPMEDYPITMDSKVEYTTERVFNNEIIECVPKSDFRDSLEAFLDNCAMNKSLGVDEHDIADDIADYKDKWEIGDSTFIEDLYDAWETGGCASTMSYDRKDSYFVFGSPNLLQRVHPHTKSRRTNFENGSLAVDWSRLLMTARVIMINNMLYSKDVRSRKKLTKTSIKFNLVRGCMRKKEDLMVSRERIDKPPDFMIKSAHKVIMNMSRFRVGEGIEVAPDYEEFDEINLKAALKRFRVPLVAAHEVAKQKRKLRKSIIENVASGSQTRAKLVQQVLDVKDNTYSAMTAAQILTMAENSEYEAFGMYLSKRPGRFAGEMVEISIKRHFHYVKDLVINKTLFRNIDAAYRWFFPVRHRNKLLVHLMSNSNSPVHKHMSTTATAINYALTDEKYLQTFVSSTAKTYKRFRSIENIDSWIPDAKATDPRAIRHSIAEKRARIWMKEYKMRLNDSKDKDDKKRMIILGQRIALLRIIIDQKGITNKEHVIDHVLRHSVIRYLEKRKKEKEYLETHTGYDWREADTSLKPMIKWAVSEEFLSKTYDEIYGDSERLLELLTANEPIYINPSSITNIPQNEDWKPEEPQAEVVEAAPAPALLVFDLGAFDAFNALSVAATTTQYFEEPGLITVDGTDLKKVLKDRFGSDWSMHYDNWIECLKKFGHIPEEVTLEIAKKEVMRFNPWKDYFEEEEAHDYDEEIDSY